ncbi:MAG: hypothetical protein WD492_12805 [Alkalispirochaeta sp.]
MPARKKYIDPEYYEQKLDRVMERLGVTEDPNYNFDRHQAWIEFRYRGQLYRFDLTVEAAQEAGSGLNYGSDCFAQLVLGLEDLARLVERRVYDLQTWVAGMKYLPPVTELPECFRLLGFKEMPGSATEVRARYKTLAKQYHPDNGGDAEDFERIRRAAEQSMKHMEAG